MEMITDNNIETRLKKILVDELSYPLNIEQIREDTSLYGKGLGLDSLDGVSLVVQLEEEFDIFFEPEEFVTGLETFGSLLRIIRSKLAPHVATPCQE